MSYVIRRGDNGRAELVESDSPIPNRSVSATGLRQDRNGRTVSFDPTEPNPQAEAEFRAANAGRDPDLHPHALGVRRQSCQLVWKDVDGKPQQVYELRAHHGAPAWYTDPTTGQPIEALNTSDAGRPAAQGPGSMTINSWDGGPYHPSTGKALVGNNQPMTLQDYQRQVHGR